MEKSGDSVRSKMYTGNPFVLVRPGKKGSESS